MNYIIDPMWFYWISVIDCFKIVVCCLSAVRGSLYRSIFAGFSLCIYWQRRVAHQICVACTHQKMALARYVVCRWCEQVRRWALARRRSFVSSHVRLSDSTKSPRQNGRGLVVCMRLKTVLLTSIIIQLFNFAFKADEYSSCRGVTACKARELAADSRLSFVACVLILFF